MATQAQIITWINTHDCGGQPAIPVGADKILVQAAAGRGDNWVTVCEVIPATIQAARDWLQY